MTGMKPGPRPIDRRAVEAWRTQRQFMSRGTLTQLADYLSIRLPAVSKWPYVPRGRLAETAEFLGVEPSQLRPDLYPARMPWNDLLNT